MIGDLCDATGIARRQVYNVTLAGNTTMQQLFCGIDPSPLGEVPFVPAVQTGAGLSGSGRRLADPSSRPGLRPADHRRFRRRRHRRRHTGNGAGRLHEPDAADRYRHQRRDCALGGRPAYGHLDRRRAGLRRCPDRPGDAGLLRERSRRSWSIRQLQVHVIGHVPPLGLCGSALIDATAELLRHGILSPQGRLHDARRTARRRAAGPCPANRSCAIGKRSSCLPTGQARRGKKRRVDPARLARGAVGLRSDSCRHRVAAEAPRTDAERPRPRASRRRIRQLYPPRQCPADGSVAARHRHTNGSATKATPRWPGHGWSACRGVAGKHATSLPHEPSTSIFRGSRILPTAFADAMIFPEA